jgi:hypothetical protein
MRLVHFDSELSIVACYATRDAVRIVDRFYYNLTSCHYNYFLHYCAFTQFPITTH